MIDSWLGRFASFQKNFPELPRVELHLRYIVINPSQMSTIWRRLTPYPDHSTVLLLYTRNTAYSVLTWRLASWKVEAVCACSGFFDDWLAVVISVAAAVVSCSCWYYCLLIPGKRETRFALARHCRTWARQRCAQAARLAVAGKSSG